jgi:hypothetical protein
MVGIGSLVNDSDEKECFCFKNMIKTLSKTKNF